MKDLGDVLAQIAARPEGQWSELVAQRFPNDAKLAAQALIWLRANRELGVGEIDGEREDHLAGEPRQAPRGDLLLHQLLQPVPVVRHGGLEQLPVGGLGDIELFGPREHVLDAPVGQIPDPLARVHQSRKCPQQRDLLRRVRPVAVGHAGGADHRVATLPRAEARRCEAGQLRDLVDFVGAFAGVHGPGIRVASGHAIIAGLRGNSRTIARYTVISEKDSRQLSLPPIPSPWSIS